MAVVAPMKRGGGEDSNAAPAVSDTLRAMANLREGDMHRFHERQRQAEDRSESSRRRPRRSARRPSVQAAKEAERQERQAVRQEKVKEVQSMVIGRMRTSSTLAPARCSRRGVARARRRRAGSTARATPTVSIDGSPGSGDGDSPGGGGGGSRRRSPTDRSRTPAGGPSRATDGRRRAALAARGARQRRLVAVGGDGARRAVVDAALYRPDRGRRRPPTIASTARRHAARPAPQPSSDRSEAADARSGRRLAAPWTSRRARPSRRGASSSVGRDV